MIGNLFLVIFLHSRKDYCPLILIELAQQGSSPQMEGCKEIHQEEIKQAQVLLSW